MSDEKDKTIFPNDGRMKPMIILPPDMMSEADIKELRANGICVVISKDPAAVRFVDPIPSMAQRDKIEDAAIELSRKILSGQISSSNGGFALSRSELCRVFTEILIEGTKLSADVDLHQRIFKQTKEDEIRKIAREEARAEAAKRKADKLKVNAVKA